MYNLYRVSNLAVWLQQINKLLLTYLLKCSVLSTIYYRAPCPSAYDL